MRLCALMRLRRGWISILGLASCLSAALASPPRCEADEPTAPHVVGINNDYPPYEFVNEDGKPDGYDVDLIQAVADTAGILIEIRSGAWSEVRSGLERGEIDVLAGMLYSTERDEWADFTDAILKVDYSIFVRVGTKGIQVEDDLRGREVIVERGSLMHDYMSALNLADSLVLVDSEPEALQLLASGECDCALVPYRQGLDIIRRHGLSNAQPTGPPIYQAQVCFAVLQGRVELLAQLNDGLSMIQEGGRFQTIYNHWFGAPEHAESTGSRASRGRWMVALTLLASPIFVWLWLRSKRQTREAQWYDESGRRRLGSYTLVERLGEGGMGEVWRAEHYILGRPAAVKLISERALRGDGNVEHARSRFEQEARATATLRSPHTVELYDYGRTPDGTFFYVMELLEGLDLQALVKRFGPLPAERVVHLIHQACESLEDAHRHGLIHRDIKPANIFACRLGTTCDFVKVLDFGLVKSRRPEPGEATNTEDGTLFGSPAYVAPEMLLGTTPIDHRADLYSLACTAYWLLTGTMVFEGTTTMRMLIDHASTMPDLPSHRSELHVPADLEAILMACLWKSPEARPNSAEELADALAGCSVFGDWTPERATAWWQSHVPELACGEPEALR